MVFGAHNRPQRDLAHFGAKTLLVRHRASPKTEAIRFWLSVVSRLVV
jgi:hypothetical protein